MKPEKRELIQGIVAFDPAEFTGERKPDFRDSHCVRGKELPNTEQWTEEMPAEEFNALSKEWLKHYREKRGNWK